MKEPQSKSRDEHRFTCPLCLKLTTLKFAEGIPWQLNNLVVTCSHCNLCCVINIEPLATFVAREKRDPPGPEKEKRRRQQLFFSAGMNLDAKGRTKEAFASFRKAAHLGHRDAALSVGCMMRDGRGTRRNATGALRWFKKAIQNNSTIAMVCAGRILLRGKARSKKQAIALFTRAAKHGDLEGVLNLGYSLLIGDGTRRNVPRAMRLIRKAAQMGLPPAQAMLAALYKVGQIVPRNEKLAFAWEKKYKASLSK